MLSLVGETKGNQATTGAAASASTAEPVSHGVDRRRGLRIHQTRPIKVYEPASMRYIGGQTQDVSATGLRVELPASAPVCEGKLLNVHVGLSDSGEALANRRQMIPARVVWINRRLSGGKVRLLAGLEFVASTAARSTRSMQAHLDAA